VSTRDALLDAAEQLLDAGGVEAVTLREVGSRAGVSHNAPYKHFASKEALLAAVAARELNRHAALLAAGGQPPETVLRAMLHRYVESAIRYPNRFRLIFGRWTTGTPELDEAAGTAWRHLVATVSLAQQRGALPPGDPERVTALLRATAHGAADLALAGHLSSKGKGHADPDELVDDLLGHLRPGPLQTPPADPLRDERDTR
jgi:AcrR family transcriptional regulator